MDRLTNVTLVHIPREAADERGCGWPDRVVVEPVPERLVAPTLGIPDATSEVDPVARSEQTLRRKSVRSFISTADEALHARRVFGDPIERGGITVIRCARHGRRRNRDGPDAGRPSEGREGLGRPGPAAGSASAPTAGVYEFKGESVHFVPSVDVNQVILGGQIVMIVLLLAIRAIANIRAKTAEREAAERHARRPPPRSRRRSRGSGTGYGR